MKAKSEQILPLFMPLAQVLYTEPTSDIIALKDSQTSQEFERGFKGGGGGGWKGSVTKDGRTIWKYPFLKTKGVEITNARAFGKNNHHLTKSSECL